MDANKSARISLSMPAVRALRMGVSGLETLRPLAGDARPLGNDLTAGYAFLACDATAAYKGTLRELVRSFVWLPGPGALLDCDIAVSGDSPAAVTWKLEGPARPESVARVLPRRSPPPAASETLFLNVIWTAEPREWKAIDSIELAGVRIADRVVAFYTETRMARSMVSFDVDGPEKLQILVTGLAPGEWEIWYAGMLDTPDAEVKPEAGALYFEGRPGGYFLRRLGS
jgi:hypothetical protein